MAKDNVIGMAMDLDVSNLRAGLTETKKMIKSAEQDFKLATAGMDGWQKSTTGINEKLKLLSTQLNAQNKNVAGYKAQIEALSQEEGDNSAAIENLNEKLRGAEIAVKKTESEISKYSASLAKAEAIEKNSASSLVQLTDTINSQKDEISKLENEYKSAVVTYGKNSKEAKNLAKQLDDLNSELSKNEKESKKADKALEGLSKSAEESEKEIDDLKNSLKNIGSGAVKGMAGIGAAVAGLGAAFLSTAESTREFRTNMAKLETGFTQAGLTAKDAENTYKDLYAVLGDEGQATEASAMIAQMAKNQDDLAKYTTIATGVYATFGASLPIENLMEASNETAKTGQLTGGLADALNWAGVNEEKFQEQLDACNSETERSALITNKLNTIYGDTAKAYETNNKDLLENNKAQAELADTMAELGKQAEPIITKFKLMGAELAEKLLPVAIAIIEKVQDNMPEIKKKIEEIAPVIATIGAAVLGVIAVMKTYQTVMLAVNAVTNAAKIAQMALNAVMALNPVGLVITAVLALVAAFTVLWNKSDTFRNFWINLWENIKNVTKNVSDSIANFFTQSWDKIKNIWSTVGSFFQQIVAGIIAFFVSIPIAISSFFYTAWNNVKNTWSTVKSFFSGIVKNILDVFVSLPSEMLDIGKNLVKGLWNGIKDMTSWITGKLSGFAGDVLGGIKSFFGIKSPSKETAEIGGYLAEGLAVGMDAKSDVVTDAGINAGNEIIAGVEEGAENKSFIDKIIDWIKNLLGLSDLDATGENAGAELGKGVATGTVATFTETLQKNKGATKKSWKDWFTEITKVTDFSNGKEAAEKYLKTFEKKFENAKTVSELLGEKFDAVPMLEAQRDAIKSVLTDMFGIDSSQINESFTSADESVQLLVARYQELSAQLNTGTESAFETIINKFKEAVGITSKDAEQWKNGIGSICAGLGASMNTVGSKLQSVFSAQMDLMNVRAENQTRALDDEYQKYCDIKDKELSKCENACNDELSALQTQLDSGAINEQQYAEKKLQIENNLADAQKRIEDEKLAHENELNAEKNKIAKKQFDAQKKNNVAMTILNGATAIVKGFAELGPIGGLINMGVQAGITTVQLAAIKAQEFVPQFAKGGVVENPTLAMIGENGKEAVMPLENNIGWIEELAEKLNVFMNKDFSFNNRLTPAYAGVSSNSVVNNYYQTINAPSALSRHDIYRNTKNLLSLKGV